MKRLQILVIAAGGTAAFLLLFFLLTGNYSRHFTLSSFNFGHIQEYKGFNEALKLGEDPVAVSKQYEKIRGDAKAKANSFIRNREIASIVYNILCTLAVIASFGVSYMGAFKGVFIQQPDATEIGKLKRTDKKFRQRIIVLSITSLLLTTLSNRAKTLYDDNQNKAGELIDLVKNTDIKINAALNLKEVINYANALELDIAKY